MAYDETLAQRIREMLGPLEGLTEKKMFGGLAFLLNGHMTIAASGQGGALVRVDPAKTDEILGSTKAELMEMRGHTMPGWLRVKTEDITDEQLDQWIGLSISYARTLPPK